MEIKGKRIVVTGAASGIGRSLVEMLSGTACQVVAADINQDRLTALHAQLSDKAASVLPFVGDLADPVQVEALFAQALELMGGIDIFIANAGFPYYEVVGEPDWGHIERIFRANVYSPIYAAVKMKDLYPSGGYKFVMTASGMAKIGIPGYALYSASKAAIDRFADAYRFELSDAASLMLVYPIATRTRFFEAASEKTAPLPWPSQPPEVVAKAILNGILRDRKVVIPSKLFWWILKLGRVFPGLYRLEQRIELRRLHAWLDEKDREAL